MKVALVYDRLNKFGGAERILLALHKIFPDAPLYTSVYSREKTSWANVFDVRTSFLQKVKFFHNNNQLIPILMPLAFESFNFDEYDLVISVSSEAAKGIITKPSTTHVCYCLTPTRYLWSGYDDYFSNNLFKFVSKPAVGYLRNWDKIAAKRPDHIVSISTEVKKRVKKYYGRDSEIIYPPVMLRNNSKKKIKDNNFFLLVSRMSRFSYYKKIDLAVEAFNIAGYPLKIVGTGDMKKDLKAKAGDNIEFLGDLTDEELVFYYERCSALIFPGKEDFGLVMAEAQSFGKPLIAYGKGGALDIVTDKKTGILFEKQDIKSILKALDIFNKKSYNTQDLMNNSKKFSFGSFKTNFENLIDKKL